MAFLQKVSFCKITSKNTGLFSACRRKKIVFAVASYISFLTTYLDGLERVNRLSKYLSLSPVLNPSISSPIDRFPVGSL